MAAYKRATWCTRTWPNMHVCVCAHVCVCVCSCVRVCICARMRMCVSVCN